MPVNQLRIAVLASGRGTDFQSIIDAVERGEVTAKIILLLSDNPEAKAIERAKRHKISTLVINPKYFASREEFDSAIWKKLNRLKLDLVVLAGYMRIIKNKAFLDAYKGRIINIHPSLLPKFPGAHAQKDAFEAGEKVSGYTIHFVDSSLDGGPIILQEKVDISSCRTADEVSAKILFREHIGLPKAVQMFAQGEFRIENGKAVYKKL